MRQILGARCIAMIGVTILHWLSVGGLRADDASAISVLEKQIVALKSANRHREAEVPALKMLAIAEGSFQDQPTVIANCLRSLASLYVDLGQYAKAEPLYQRCLMIREAKLGPDHALVADSLDNLAILYGHLGRFADAVPLFLRSIKIKESIHGPDHLAVARSLNNLAIVYSDLGQYTDAEPLFQRSLKIVEARLGPDQIPVAIPLNGLANLYIQIGQYAKAESLLNRCIRIRETKQGVEHPDMSICLNNLAELYRTRGQYAAAEPLLRRNLKIKETALGIDHPDVALAVENLANFSRDLGQFSQAEALYLRAIKIYEAKLGVDHPHLAHSLNDLANVYNEMDQPAKAEPLYERSLKICELRLGPDHPDLSIILDNLATLSKKAKQFSKAESLYQRALKIRESKLGPDHPDLAISLTNLAIMHVDKGQYADAELLYDRSLEIRMATLGAEHPDVARGLNNLALLHMDMGQEQKAATEFDRSRRIVRRHVTSVLPALSEREQLTFLQQRDEPFFHGALLFGRRQGENPQLAEQSAGWLLNGKGVVQESLAERALLARENADPALVVTINNLVAVRTELAKLSLIVPKQADEATRRQKLAELFSQEKDLSQQVNLAAGRPTQENPWIETASVRRALPAGAVLVDMVRFGPFNFGAKNGRNSSQSARYVAWILPPWGHGNVQIVDLGDADEIDKAVAQARKVIEQSAEGILNPEDEVQAEQSSLDTLAALAHLTLDPLKPHLSGVKQLILSPDSNLWLVPWSALPVEDGKYALEQWQIRYVLSGRELVTEPLTVQSSQRKLTRPRIFADPDYNLNSQQALAATRAVLRGKESNLALRSAAERSQNGLPKVGRLPATATEAKLITPSLAAYAHEMPTVYQEQYALEGVLKMVQSPKVLVLSTHGYYLPDQEVKIADRENPLGESEGSSHRSVSRTFDGTPLENPLLRCGLLLAGCNQPSLAGVDDGVVTGMEIVGCDLRGTDLVVLSACETGLGQVRNGEGVAGLRQAFQLAGARAVVSTLWRIPDAETATLMSDFFSNLAAGQSKPEALRSAQLTQINARRQHVHAAHPFYWAAFTVTGN